MLVNFYHKICIITPPRTGGSSLHKSLEMNFAYVYGPQLDGECGQHTVHLPHALLQQPRKYKYYILTRHPYTRLLSLYGLWKQRFDNSINFDFFVKKIVIPNRSIFFGSPTSNWVSYFEKVNPGLDWIELQFNDVKQRLLQQYNLNIQLQHINKSEHGSLNEEYTAELLYLAKNWAYWDFQLFNYDSEPWW